MSDGKSETETDADSNVGGNSDLRGSQFGIGQIMAVTVGMSVVCAVLAAVLRRLPEDQQVRGMIFILAMILLCIAVLAYFFVRRGFVERQAGKCHFVTKDSITSWFHVCGIGACVATLAMMAAGLVFVSQQVESFRVWQFAYLFWMLVAFSGKYLISHFLWKTSPNSVEVRTNGLVLGMFLFVPWEHFHGFRWNKFTKKLMLLSKGRFLERKVPENQREPLERALVDFLPKKEGF